MTATASAPAATTAGAVSRATPPMATSGVSAGTRRRQAATRSRPRGAKGARLERAKERNDVRTLLFDSNIRWGSCLLLCLCVRAGEGARGVFHSAGSLKTFGKSLADCARFLTFEALRL